MALSDIIEQIRTEIGGRTDLDSVIADQINFAIQETCTFHEFKELQISATAPTNEGQTEYLLPSDLYILHSVKEETVLNRRLIYKDYHSYDETDETITGVPRFYTERNNVLFIFGPAPDDNNGSNYLLKISYWKRHPNLVLSSDALLTPVEWERIIRLRATAYMFTVLDQDEKAAAKHAEADRTLGRIRLPIPTQKERAFSAGLNFGNPYTNR